MAYVRWENPLPRRMAVVYSSDHCFREWRYPAALLECAGLLPASKLYRLQIGVLFSRLLAELLREEFRSLPGSVLPVVRVTSLR